MCFLLEKKGSDFLPSQNTWLNIPRRKNFPKKVFISVLLTLVEEWELIGWLWAENAGKGDSLFCQRR